MNIGDLVLGKYEITDILWKGGEGFTGKARDTTAGLDVAIKQLEIHADASNPQECLARFERAGKLRIGHPNVVDPIDYGEEGGLYYVITPFISGENLESSVQSHKGRLTPDHVEASLCQIADGLQAIHDHGVIHRDLKPSNIISGTDGRAHIIDFGICRKLNEQTITGGNGLLGSLPWMSPEQLDQAQTVDVRSDLYSLGVICYFLLTGQQAAIGDTPGEIAMSVMKYTPPSPRAIDPNIPEHLDRICMHLMVKNPEHRFQTARDLLQALRGAQPTVSPTPASGSGSFCPSCGHAAAMATQFCTACGAGFAIRSQITAHCLACGRVVGQERACPGCNRTFSPDNHRLLFSAGPLTGHEFRIPEGQFEVGRDELLARDHHISRRHLVVASLNGQVLVQDAGSTNKTMLNGQPADQPTPLCAGCHLGIASNTATYLKN